MTLTPPKIHNVLTFEFIADLLLIPTFLRTGPYEPASFLREKSVTSVNNMTPSPPERVRSFFFLIDRPLSSKVLDAVLLLYVPAAIHLLVLWCPPFPLSAPLGELKVAMAASLCVFFFFPSRPPSWERTGVIRFAQRI